MVCGRLYRFCFVGIRLFTDDGMTHYHSCKLQIGDLVVFLDQKEVSNNEVTSFIIVKLLIKDGTIAWAIWNPEDWEEVTNVCNVF